MAQIETRPPGAGSQMELPLPPIAIEAVLVERMMTVISENTSNVALCGQSILLLQEKVEALSANVAALLEAYRASVSPGQPGREPTPAVVAEPSDPPGHPGYTVKEFAQLTKRSESYVYRLIAENQVAKNMAGRITHQSLLRMRMEQAGMLRRPRKPKWGAPE